VRARRPLPLALGLLASLVGALNPGCAQIAAESEIHTVVRPDAQPIARETKVVQRALEARWSQRGAELEVDLRELRMCQTVTHLPARQEERIVRRPDAMIYWEYGLAAAALGVAALAFARPELFAPAPTYDAERMQYVRETKAGYVAGGLFTGLGVGLLTAGIVDSVRARDGVRRSDTVALRAGPVAACEPPEVPASGRAVELVIGGQAFARTTDRDGRVRFTLPAEGEADPELEPSTRAVAATLQVGFVGGLPLTLVAPYAQTAQAPHTGAVRSGPL
jgi:hypothetical protein